MMNLKTLHQHAVFLLYSKTGNFIYDFTETDTVL